MAKDKAQADAVNNEQFKTFTFTPLRNRGLSVSRDWFEVAPGNPRDRSLDNL